MKNNKKITTKLLIATMLFLSANFAVFAQDTVKTFGTITQALNYDGDRSEIKHLIITDSISGEGYEIGSEWREFRSLNLAYPALSEITIHTDQDIPDGGWESGNMDGSFMGGEPFSGGALWIKKFNGNNIKYVGDDAFASCPNLTHISLNSVEIIGKRSFISCRSTSIYFPLLTKIGDNAFSGSSFNSVYFPSCIEIGEMVFYLCTQLITANFPKAKIIGGGSFSSCFNLKFINFPEATTLKLSSGPANGTFVSCWSLDSAYFPRVTSIENQAFSGCSNLVYINFPLVENIGDGAFGRCVNLSNASFGTSLETETKIEFGWRVFGQSTTKATENVELTLGDFVLPLPNLVSNTWQTDSGNGLGTPYVWKMIKTNIIEKIIKNSIVNIFPNPTTHLLTVSLELKKNSNLELILCDVLGKEISELHNGFAEEGLFTKTFTIENLSKGVYFLRISTDDGNNITMEKIVVK